MQITKLRVRDENGLVPAGRYFEKLATTLRATNTREQTRISNMDAEDRDIQSDFRRASSARRGTLRRLHC